MSEFSSAVDEAIVGATRVVIVRSANAKFFSAGADIKKFLEGDVDANMEMIKVSQAAFRRMAAAPQVFIASRRRPRARRRARDRARVRHPAGRGGRLQAGHARGDARSAARQRRHAAAHSADRPEPGARAAAHRPHVRASRRHARWGSWRPSTTRKNAEAQVREYAERLAAGPALAIAAIKRCVHEGGELPLADGLALEAELMEHSVQVQGRVRRAERVRREAHAGVRRRMTTETLTTYAGSFIAGARARQRRRRRSRSSTPPTASRSPRSPARPQRTSTTAVQAAAKARSATGPRSRCQSAARSSAAPPTTSRSTSTS